MEAILLASNPDFTPLFRGTCACAGIPIRVVRSWRALRQAALAASPEDLVIIDCLGGEIEAARHRTQLTKQVTAHILILHHDRAFVEDLASTTSSAVEWIPANTSWHALLARLRTLKAQATAGITADDPLDVDQAPATGC